MKFFTINVRTRQTKLYFCNKSKCYISEMKNCKLYIAIIEKDRNPINTPFYKDSDLSNQNKSCQKFFI